MEKYTNYNHILWDWNGTLFDDIDASINSVNRTLEKHNLPLLNKDRYFKLFCFPVEKYYKKLGFNLGKISYAELAKEYIENYLEFSKKHANLHKGAKDSLEYINSLGISQSILSASQKDILKERLSYYGIASYFENIIALDNIYAESKLNIGLAWKRKRKRQENIVLIGDSPHDYEVAKSMNIDCILFAGGHSRWEDLVQEKTMVITKLSQLKNLIV